MASIRGSSALVLVGVLSYLATFFLMPIYERLWIQYVMAIYPLLTLQIFGYILLALSLAFLMLFLVTKKGKTLRRNGFFILFVFFLINAIPYIFQLWFFSFWRF